MNSQDKVNLDFPRQTPKDIITAEEEERTRRMSEGADPMLLAKQHKVEQELVKKVPGGPHTLTGKAMEAKDALMEKAQPMTDKLVGFKDTVMEKASGLVQTVKDSYYKVPSDQCTTWTEVNKAEETERTRRMSDPVNPLVLARKHRVESELLSTVKPAK